MNLVARLTYSMLLLVVMLLLSTCGSSEDNATSPIDSSPLAPGDSPLRAPTDGLSEAEQEAVSRLYELAAKDLATDLGVAVSEVELVAVEPVMWRDSSLGCPQPGMMYTQVITPGYRLTLEVAGERYVYHTDGGSRVVSCEEPTQ